MTEAEQWRAVPGYPGYSASNLGRIRGPRKVRRTRLDAYGYPFVALWLGGGLVRGKCVHQLVARAWLGPRPSPRHEVAHWDGDRTNSRVENLRWATRKENDDDMDRHGTRRRGESHPHAKLTEPAVIEIRRRYAQGESRHSIAADLGVGHICVWLVAKRKRWAHVPDAAIS